MVKEKVKDNTTANGLRRQNIKEHQNNKREKHNPPEYKDFNGNELK